MVDFTTFHSFNAETKKVIEMREFFRGNLDTFHEMSSSRLTDKQDLSSFAVQKVLCLVLNGVEKLSPIFITFCRIEASEESE